MKKNILKKSLNLLFIILVLSFATQFIFKAYADINTNEAKKLIKNTSDLKTSTLLTNDDKYYLVIPNLNIQTPILEPKYNDNKEINELLLQGVVRDLLSSPIGLKGNTVIFGHSSNNRNEGKFNNIFKKLVNIKIGDEIFIFQNFQQYRYIVEETFIVNPNDRSILENIDDKKMLTLYTCYPVGTDNQRFVVRAIMKE
jgi:LPXTG-site transpeptidase (sortase) family protein